MATQHHTFVLFLVLLFEMPTYQSIQCPKSSNCWCTNDEPCMLNCIGEDQCKGSDIQLICKSSQPCTINCNGPKACQDATVQPNGATDVTMICTGGDDVCNSDSTTFNCGIAQCSVNCDENSDDSCDSMRINVNTATSFQCIGNCPSNAPAPYTVAPTPAPAVSTTTTTAAPTATKSTHGNDGMTISIMPPTVTNSKGTASSSTSTSIVTENSNTVGTLSRTPTTTPLILANSDASDENNTSTPVIIIIVVMVFLFYCGLCLCIFFIYKRKHKSSDTYNHDDKMNGEEGADIQGHNAMQIVTFHQDIGIKQKLTDTLQHTVGDGDSSDTSSSEPPPPPPPLPTDSMMNTQIMGMGNKAGIKVFSPNTAFGMDSDASLYAQQQKYMQEEMYGRNKHAGSLGTIITTTTNLTDASLYALQQKYLQEEMNVVPPGANVNDGHRETVSTDVSLYQKQQQYLQEEINQKENAMKTPGGL